MNYKKLDFVIERKLKFEINGQVMQGKLRIGGIQKRGKSYGCYCYVSHLLRKGRRIYGVDPWQALTLGLGFVRRLIKEEANAAGIEIWCYERGDME